MSIKKGKSSFKLYSHGHHTDNVRVSCMAKIEVEQNPLMTCSP